VRELLRRPLYARFDSIDHKLNFILHDVTAKADNLSAKTDHSLWTISKKLDTYVADLQEYQIQMRQVLSQESAASNEALARFAATADRKLAGISRILESHVEQQAQAQEVLRREIAVNAEATGAAQAGILARIADIENRQTELLAQLAGLRETTAGRAVQNHRRTGQNQEPPVSPSHRGRRQHRGHRSRRLHPRHARRRVARGGLPHLPRRHGTRPRQAFPDPGQPGMVVVDVGANIGVFTLYAARLLAGQGRIYSFEPTPRTFRILRDNVQVNGFLELGLIQLHQSAVSDRAGQAEFVVFPENGGHNTLFDDGGTAARRIEVSTVRLDDVLGGEPRVDIVKIDAEGAEPLILRGMQGILARSPGIRILLEFAPVHLRRAGVDPLAFLDEIASCGFEFRRVHDETGQLMDTARDQLAAVFSANLELSRPAGDCGEPS